MINEAGIPFTGHTEFLKSDRTPESGDDAGDGSDAVALVTTHLPIKAIPDAITPELLREIIGILHHDLQTKFGIKQPHVLVCGLNPRRGRRAYD